MTYGYQWEQCDGEGDNCQPITGAQSAAYTPAPSDVGHTLRVTVAASDSDGVTSVASAATSAVLPVQGSGGAPNGPGTPPGGGTSGGGSTPAQGAPNGSGASEIAQVQLGTRRSILRTYARRAFRVSGRLLNGQGQPIAGATLDVLQQTGGGAASVLIGKTTTAQEGTFRVVVPGGPSRQVTIAYRAFSGNSGYAAQATIRETVSAGASLRISPARTSPTGTIVVSGHVSGAIPPQGVIVELSVRYHGRWEPIRTPRTNAGGYFQIEYQFNNAIGRYPFRVVVPGGQAGFGYGTGYSKSVDVHTG